jgi:molybdopterin adenylyltransferase
MQEIRVGVLTVSDRASSGVYEDLSGKAVKEYVLDRIKNKCNFEYLLLPDNSSEIKQGLIRLCDKMDCSLVLTTGGTGPTPKDLTPDVTKYIVSRELPGFGELMRMTSLKYVPTSILSRQTAGIRGNSLIINLPGSPKAVSQCLDAVFDAIPDCLKLIGGPEIIDNKNKTQIYH